MRRIFAFMLLLGCAAMCGSCGDFGTSSKPSRLETQRAIWRSHDVHNYVMKQSLSGGWVPLGVKLVYVQDDRIVNVVSEGDGTSNFPADSAFYKTVDQLFDFATAVSRGQADVFIVEYDSTYGYPSMIFVDPHKSWMDDEMGFTTTGMQIGYQMWRIGN